MSNTPPFPSFPTLLSDFIAHLFNSGLAPTTIATYLSAVSYVHKLADKPDPTHSFVVQRMLKGCLKLQDSKDPRLPILPNILNDLITSCPSVLHDPYDAALMQAVYTTMFHAFLRLGEAAVRSPSDINKVIQFCDVSCSISPSPSMSVHIRHYKHNKSREPFIIHIQASGGPTCPVALMRAYIQLRGNLPGPLFCFPCGLPLNQSTFNSLFKRSLNFLNLNPKLYLPHSFRIGAATHAARSGLPAAEIQHLGRWNSSAFKRYIRFSALSFP